MSNSLDVVDFFVALTKADQDTKLGFEHKEVVNSNTTSFRALKIEDEGAVPTFKNDLSPITDQRDIGPVSTENDGKRADFRRHEWAM